MFKKSRNTIDVTQLSSSFIGEGCVVTGDIKCNGRLRIDGRLIGNIYGDGDVEIAANGIVNGNVCEVKNITIQGEVKSNINAQGSIHLLKHANVEGDISAASLDTESGAQFIGYSKTNQSIEAVIIKPKLQINNEATKSIPKDAELVKNDV